MNEKQKQMTLRMEVFENDETKPLGSFPFARIPREGEWIRIDQKDDAQTCRYKILELWHRITRAGEACMAVRVRAKKKLRVGAL
jgi:hypothetical protein